MAGGGGDRAYALSQGKESPTDPERRPLTASYHQKVTPVAIFRRKKPGGFMCRISIICASGFVCAKPARLTVAELTVAIKADLVTAGAI
jgi:hypothetical protein